jgi:tetratricopeptide (TPR) repeat protein
LFWIWLILTGSRKKALTYEAERLMRNKRYYQALDYYDAIAGEWPDDPMGFEGIGKVYTALGIMNEAVRMETIAACLVEVENDPSDFQLQMKTAEAFVAAKLYNLALSYGEKALRLAPQNLKVLKQGSLILRHNRQYGKALAAIKQAMRLNPLDAELYEMMAINLKGLGRQEDSRRAFSLSKALAKVRKTPDSGEDLDSAVFHFTMAGARNLGLKLLDESLEQFPDSFDLNVLKGKVCLEEQQAEQANKFLYKAVQLDPTSQDAHFLLARSYYMLGKSGKSTIHQEMAETIASAKMNNDQTAGALMIIQGLLKCDMADSARRMADDMAAKNPQAWQGPYAIGLVDKQQGHYSEAIHRMQQANKHSGKATDPLLESAWILAAMKKNDAAVDMGRKAVALNPRDPVMRRKFARLLRALGHTEMAMEEEEMANTVSKRQDIVDLFD